MQSARLQDLGMMDYLEAWNYQEHLMRQHLDRKAARYAQPNERIDGTECPIHHLLLCSHPPVYTLGKSGNEANLLINKEVLAAIGATLHRTNRGGDITYHGPGQVVGYPVLDLECFFTDLGKYMRHLEEVIIQTISHWGIIGERLPGSTGVWIEPGSKSARKICAMGVKSSRWVTIHGFALNVNTDLAYFDKIVPCGIADKAVTSMAKECGEPIDEGAVKQRLTAEFSRIFQIAWLDENGALQRHYTPDKQ